MEIIPLKAPINSLSISPDFSSIICGGREILKIISLSDFSEVRNLRTGKSNLNYSTQDLAWHNTEPDYILSAAKNSCIVLWNLQRTGASKIENLFKGHSTVVNRVKWHPSMPDIFISAGQDGVLRIWDRRVAENSTHLFQCNSEGARDVSFSTNRENLIGASFDSGSVQIWDWRKQQSITRINAHKRSALTVDWHPQWPDRIASGGSDKSIKIWNSHTGEAIYKVQAPEPVARVKWFEKTPSMIASVSHTHDNNLYVWDIEKPVLPELVYRGHTQPIKDFIWGPNNCVISASDDQCLVRQDLGNAYSPKIDMPRAIHCISSLNVIAAVSKKNSKDLVQFASLGNPKTEAKAIAEVYVLKGDVEKACKKNAEACSKNRGVWKAIEMLHKDNAGSTEPWVSQIIEEALHDTIEFHAENGDLQTSASISSVLNLRGPMKEYSDFLRQLEMPTLAAKLPITHASVEIFLKCKCGKSIEDTICQKCNNIAECSICGGIVKGLFSWCQVCSHGGHASHMNSWFKTHNLCPTGCGHICNGLEPAPN